MCNCQGKKEGANVAYRALERISNMAIAMCNIDRE
jgi:hypothetical protein